MKKEIEAQQTATKSKQWKAAQYVNLHKEANPLARLTVGTTIFFHAAMYHCHFGHDRCFQFQVVCCFIFHEYWYWDKLKFEFKCECEYECECLGNWRKHEFECRCECLGKWHEPGVSTDSNIIVGTSNALGTTEMSLTSHPTALPRCPPISPSPLMQPFGETGMHLERSGNHLHIPHSTSANHNILFLVGNAFASGKVLLPSMKWDH